MPKVRPRSAFVAPCIPTRALKPPAGPEWVHEIKHDGYRLQVKRSGDKVRLFTRRGYDWSDRYPAIAATAMKLRAQWFTLDGEACVCGPDERTLPVGAVARLDQGEEFGQPGDDPGAGSGVVRRRRVGILPQ